MKKLALYKCFNPRTHTGCDPLLSHDMREDYVSIHAPTRGATLSYVVDLNLSICFNPRTHTGCDAKMKELVQDMQVSIHAPTRGATVSGGKWYVLHRVSIHAPTRGATPTAPAIFAKYLTVSIHAPTRGATSTIGNVTVVLNGFNPRTHTGCDDISYLNMVNSILFQSTHPHGVRHHFVYIYIYTDGCFNPRTHTGCDPV